MKNQLCILCSFLVLAACSDSSNVAKQEGNTVDATNIANATESTPKEYTTEELLWKTVEEFEQLNREAEAAAEQASTQSKKLVKNGFLEITWEDLVAPGYDADSIIEKYTPLIDELEHGSDAALELYKKMDAEFNSAPGNPEFASQKVSIPGFIAPLEQLNGLITEFLLVPYFGACIHMPPPPSNQTLYVKVAADYAIRNEDSYEPIWVSGELTMDGKTTDIGSASFQIDNALISKYQ